MKFATLDGQRVKPTPKARAQCSFCGDEVIAKCGRVRVWHWAHKNPLHCDDWWEPETEWHRNWKEQFPDDWQEQSRHDEHGERHIADVLTPHGLAIEFQHSHIDRDEVETRTNFHKNICWVVDGLRLKTSLQQFVDALEHADRLNSSGATVYRIYLSQSRLLSKWSNLNAPIVIDFGLDDVWVMGKNLENSVLVYSLSRELFVNQLKEGNRPPPVQVQQSRRRVVYRHPRVTRRYRKRRR